MAGGKDATEPLSTVTGRNLGSTNLTNSLCMPLACGIGPVAAGCSPSPRSTLTGLVLGSAKVTSSAAAGFSVGFASAVGPLPRMIFTGFHSVSGKVRTCTLAGLFSSICLPATTAARVLDLGEVLAG